VTGVLLRFAFVFMAISLCAPIRAYRSSDVSRASMDEDSSSVSVAPFDDDGALESTVGAPALSCGRRASAVPLVVDGSSAELFGAACGLAPAPGVTTSLFRPPRT